MGAVLLWGGTTRSEESIAATRAEGMGGGDLALVAHEPVGRIATGMTASETLRPSSSAGHDVVDSAAGIRCIFRERPTRVCLDGGVELLDRRRCPVSAVLMNITREALLSRQTR